MRPAPDVEPRGAADGAPPVAPVGPPPEWTTRQQALANVVWASFLAACVASVLFFAMVDPLELAAISTPMLEVSRMAGYAIGFFFFWAIATLASATTSFMVRTAVRRNRAGRG